MVVATSLRTGPSSTIGARPGPGWGVVGGGGRERPLRLASVLFNYSAGPLLRRGRKGCAHPGVGEGWGARRGEASAEPASQVPRGGAAQRRPQIGSRSGPSALPRAGGGAGSGEAGTRGLFLQRAFKVKAGLWAAGWTDAPLAGELLSGAAAGGGRPSGWVCGWVGVAMLRLWVQGKASVGAGACQERGCVTSRSRC